MTFASLFAVLLAWLSHCLKTFSFLHDTGWNWIWLRQAVFNFSTNSDFFRSQAEYSTLQTDYFLIKNLSLSLFVSVTIPRRRFCYVLPLLPLYVFACSGEISILKAVWPIIWERNCPFGFLLVVF